MRRIAMAAALVLAPSGAQAAADTTCQVSKLLELKITMEGLGPMTTVGINGHDERFMVDSGAFFSSISSGKAAELGLHLQPLSNGFVVKGVGGEMHPSLAVVKTVDLVGVPLRNINFIVGGGEVGNGAGLLGQNVLGIGDVEYDLAHGAIRLLRAKDCKGAVPAYWSAGRTVSTVTIDARSVEHPHTIGTVTVNGVKMRAVFDTGAGRSVMSLAAAAKLGLKPGGAGVRQAGSATGIGSHSVAVYVIPIDSIKLGDQEEIRRTHIQATTVDLTDADMLIGADFFLSHRVYVANGLHKLFFTYDGGPIFNVTPGRVIDDRGGAVAIAADTAEPTDAAGYSRRGAALMARRDYAGAIAAFDKAVAMAPTESRYVYQRAEAHQRNRQPLLAMDDLDATLKLAPDDAEARLARASIRLSRHDRAAAEEDVATVDKAAAPAADARLTLAGMYDSLAQPDHALSQYDLWLRYHPDDSRRPTALNGRCWARAQLGSDLGKALSDCDAALKARPGFAGYLDSRGLVRLRMGDNDKAIADYSAALATQPKMAGSLYGRGLAEQRAGHAADGQRDLDAALAIDPKLSDQAKRYALAR